MKLFFIYFAAIGLVCLGTGISCQAQIAPADISPDVQEVLTLSRQHMDDSVITNYIASTGKAYKLSADDIIYLNSQGVSQPVISALLATAQCEHPGFAPAPAPAAPGVTPTDGSAAPAHAAAVGWDKFSAPPPTRHATTAVRRRRRGASPGPPPSA